VRRAIKQGTLRPELAAELAQREADGKPILTPAMRRQLHLSPAVVRAFRNPRDAWLDYIQSPGSSQFCIDDDTGDERPVEPGEAWTIDDGTPNLVCNVPTMDPRWKHRVMPGRFQFLLVVDHRSYFIPGFSYTARPKGSYRAEDLIATLHIAMTEHGAPKRLILERGISAAQSLTRCCELAGIQIDRAESPHKKVVEMVFGCLWTKLSFLPGQVGRYRGEEAEVTALLESCRRGAKDPRQHFPMLADVLAGIREAIHDWNDHWVNGSRWGRWKPSEFWQESSGQHLRKIPDQDHWIYAPRVTDPLKVRSLFVATSVLLAPGVSQQHTYFGEWLVDWVGAQINIHFNPFADDSTAMATLAAPYAGQPKGLKLGVLELADQQAKYTRRAWGYSTEEDLGTAQVRRGAQSLHRSAMAIRPDGKPGVTAVEVRDGLGREVAGRGQGADTDFGGGRGAARLIDDRLIGAREDRSASSRTRYVDPGLAEFFEEEESPLTSTLNHQPSTTPRRDYAQVE
jgi:hypothetical protein